MTPKRAKLPLDDSGSPTPGSWPEHSDAECSTRMQHRTRVRHDVLRERTGTFRPYDDRANGGEHEPFDEAHRSELAAVEDVISSLTGWTRDEVRAEAMWSLFRRVEEHYVGDGFGRRQLFPEAASTPAPYRDAGAPEDHEKALRTLYSWLRAKGAAA